MTVSPQGDFSRTSTSTELPRCLCSDPLTRQLEAEGFWYLANLGQALVILAVAVVLLWKRPLWVLPLPVLSLLLMLIFEAVDPSTKITECTERELSAIAELPPPPGRPPLDFQSQPSNGCIARLEPGKAAPQSPGPLGMSNETVTAAVNHERAGDEGPARDQLWVVVEIHERPT